MRACIASNIMGWCHPGNMPRWCGPGQRLGAPAPDGSAEEAAARFVENYFTNNKLARRALCNDKIKIIERLLDYIQAICDLLKGLAGNDAALARSFLRRIAHNQITLAATKALTVPQNRRSPAAGALNPRAGLIHAPPSAQRNWRAGKPLVTGYWGGLTLVGGSRPPYTTRPVPPFATSACFLIISKVNGHSGQSQSFFINGLTVFPKRS